MSQNEHFSPSFNGCYQKEKLLGQEREAEQKAGFSLVHKSNLAAQLFAPSASHQPATWAQRRPQRCSFGSSWHCWNMILDFQQHFLKWTSLEACTCLWWSRCLDHNTLGSQQPGVPTTAVDREKFVCLRLMSSAVSFLVLRLVLWFLPFANWLIFKLKDFIHTRMSGSFTLTYELVSRAKRG